MKRPLQTHLYVPFVPRHGSKGERGFWGMHQSWSGMEESTMDLDDSIVGEEDIRREKEKARRLRQSAWWMRKIGGGVCYYCRRKVGRANLTMDHVVPLSRGGRSAKGNIVPACKECNNKKKYLLPIEWKEYLESLSEEFKSDIEL